MVRSLDIALKHLCILGSTGSIGTSALSIVERYPERFAIASLAAGRNLDLAFSQCKQWRPQLISVATEELAAELSSRLKAAGLSGTEVVHGTAGTVRAATLPDVDFVVSAIVGLGGLEATHAAVAAGKQVGLANKEAMVAAGEILTRLARDRKVPLLPIDIRLLPDFLSSPAVQPADMCEGKTQLHRTAIRTELSARDK